MKVLFVVGPHASGKTYSINESLAENNIKSTIVDTGPIMRRKHQESGSVQKIGKWVCELEQLYGNDITSKIIANEIEKQINLEQNENVIIIGYRTFDSIKYLVNYLQIEDFQIIYVDAPISLLYQNYCAREGAKKTFNEFEFYIHEEEKSGLVLLKAYAMLNNENFQYFYKQTNDDTFKGLITDYFRKPKTKKKKIGEF